MATLNLPVSGGRLAPYTTKPPRAFAKLAAPFKWTLVEGAKGVQLAEAGLRSWKERRWIDIPALKV